LYTFFSLSKSLPGGGYAEYCAVPAATAIRIPEKMSFEEAAAIPEAFLTAYQALHWYCIDSPPAYSQLHKVERICE
jgi:NADPH:quinone reductase-like Zn-dependent oxidoreductase